MIQTIPSDIWDRQSCSWLFFCFSCSHSWQF